MIEFNVYGFPALYEDLQKVDYARQKTLLVRAVRAGGEPIRQSISALAPVSTGTLRDSIIMTTAGTKSDINRVEILIGASVSAFYSGFMEFGTAHHPAQPHIDPGFEQGEEAALSAIAQTLGDQLDKELRGE